MGVSKNRGVSPKNGWFIIMEKPYEQMDDIWGFLTPTYMCLVAVNITNVLILHGSLEK